MTDQEKIASGGTIDVPTIVQLHGRGFTVTHRWTAEAFEWKAERSDLVIHAHSAIELLGLVALREERGPRPWHRRQDDAWDAAEDAFWAERKSE